MRTLIICALSYTDMMVLVRVRTLEDDTSTVNIVFEQRWAVPALYITTLMPYALVVSPTLLEVL